MRILGKAFSHINLSNAHQRKAEKNWAKKVLNRDIRESEPKRVNTYDELVRDVAQILHRHRNQTLFYRGQSIDYRNEDGLTSIMPSIYRKKRNEGKLMLKNRFEFLHRNVELLRKEFEISNVKYTGSIMLNKYPEISWALLQHYEVCDTPLLDLTHSLHVACSFAFDGNKSATGIIYVLGLPWQSDVMGYNTYSELMNMRLLSVVPPQAQRPFFQEGYLAGPFPNYKLDDPKRIGQFDFGRRLIAKFEIPITENFWGKGFKEIPKSKIYQPKDQIAQICKKIMNE